MKRDKSKYDNYAAIAFVLGLLGVCLFLEKPLFVITNLYLIFSFALVPVVSVGFIVFNAGKTITIEKKTGFLTGIALLIALALAVYNQYRYKSMFLGKSQSEEVEILWQLVALPAVGALFGFVTRISEKIKR